MKKNFVATNRDVNILATFAASNHLGGVTLASAPDVALALRCESLQSVNVVWGEEQGLYHWGDEADLRRWTAFSPTHETAAIVHYIAREYARLCEAAPGWDMSPNRRLAYEVRKHAALLARDADPDWDPDRSPWNRADV